MPIYSILLTVQVRLEYKPVEFWSQVFQVFWAPEYVNKRFSIGIDVECGCKKNDIKRQKVCLENRQADQLESVKIKRVQIDQI